MEPMKCTSCGQEYQEWVEFCPHCAKPIESYSRPAGFWIRVGAQIIDVVVFIPIIFLSIWNYYSLKSTTVLILTFVPGLIYKPVMEAFFGATLGKMACGIKVIGNDGKRLSVFGAYVRYFPFLIQAGVNLAGQLLLYSSEQFQSATSMMELAQAQKGNFLAPIGTIVNILVAVECIFAAFTFRKRALHDMLAESFCVYKEPQVVQSESSGPDESSEQTL